MNQQILAALISSSVLILALALLRVLLRGKISPRLQYALWLLAALRLLIPVSLGASSASVMNYVPEQQMSEVLEDASIPAQIPQAVTALPIEDAAAFTDEVLPTEAHESTQTQQAQAASPNSENQTARFQHATLTICYLIWCLGAALALDGTALPYAVTAETQSAAGGDRITLTAIVSPTAAQTLTVLNNSGTSNTYANSTLTVVKLA